MAAINQTSTSSSYLLPEKGELVNEYVGKSTSSVRTPAAVIQVDKFKHNAQAMKDRCEAVGAIFRAHVKSHKTSEGTRIQLETNPPTSAVVCSTLSEAWGIVNSGLAGSTGPVKDILYGFPIPLDKIADLVNLSHRVDKITVMIDNVYQVRGLATYVQQSRAFNSKSVNFQAFIKIDQGGSRAGLTPDSSNLEPLILEVINCPHLTLHGFYSHAGNSYASRDGDAAVDFLRIEVEAVEKAALLAHNLVKTQGLSTLNLVLSVGSTPTAHASTLLSSQSTPASKLTTSGGILEIHAGVYPLCDLQQYATGLAHEENLALGVLARACSVYTDRPTPQVLLDAGAIAFSKDTGPSGDFGIVYGDSLLRGWRLVKISQEHGILNPPTDMGADNARSFLKEHEAAIIGSLVTVRPQHACLTCAAHPWYYIIDGQGSTTIADVWVPWKGW